MQKGGEYMNSTNGERIMYYDAEQKMFVVEEILLDTNEANDITTANETTQSNMSMHHGI